MNDILIYVLQDERTEIKTEPHDWKEIDMRHETLPTINLLGLPSVKKEEVSKCWNNVSGKLQKITVKKFVQCLNQIFT